MQIFAVSVVFTRIPKSQRPSLLICLPVGQDFANSAKCGIGQHSLAGGKACQVAGREALFGLQKDGRQTTSGGDSKYATEDSDDCGRAAQIVVERPHRMRQLTARRMFSNEALTGFEVQIAPIGMRPDHQAAQRQVRGQQPPGQVEQRPALAFNAVEIVRAGGHIDHKQCLAIELPG